MIHAQRAPGRSIPMPTHEPCSVEEVPSLRPVRRSSISDSIYDELRDAITSGELVPGAALPGERTLAERFAANRGAVREALKRLEAAGLVTIHQGGPTRVLDYRLTAGLDFVTELLFARSGGFERSVLRSVSELCELIAPDIARLAALRHGAELPQALCALLAEARCASRTGERERVSDLVEDFWTKIAQHCDNVAYQLILNTVREVRDAHGGLFTRLPIERRGRPSHLEAIARAITSRDPDLAEQRVREWIEAGRMRNEKERGAIRSASS